MIWKGVGVLAVATALVILAVVGLARVTVPDVPTFAEGFEDAAESPEGSVEFVPTASGGQLTVTGDREGTMELAPPPEFSEGPGVGLTGSNGKIFFERDPISISQMYFEDLAFFPEPEDCEFTEGELNEDYGLAAATVVCPELTDIRGNGSIAVEGYVALPADMVVERDLPELGGTVTVGDETWEMADANLGIYPEFNFGGSPEPVFLGMWTGDHLKGMSFEMDRETETLTLVQVYWAEGQSDVPAGACSINTEFLIQVNPTDSIERLDFACDSVAVRGIGEVPITGSINFYKSYFEP